MVVVIVARSACGTNIGTLKNAAASSSQGISFGEICAQGTDKGGYHARDYLVVSYWFAGYYRSWALALLWQAAQWCEKKEETLPGEVRGVAETSSGKTVAFIPKVTVTQFFANKGAQGRE